ncbi:MAG: hypothetical protein II874_00695 [Bacteroidales bacterium]|nr:hypothetical protein [Bacteroidales bacterium]
MRWIRIISLLLLLFPFFSCERDGFDITLNLGPYGENVETRRVLLLYEAGFNSLSGDISSNIATLKEGWLPGKDRNDNVVLVLSHLRKGGFMVDTSPVMVRLSRTRGIVVTDTLKVWPAGTSLANAEMVNEVFNWVRDEFPAAGYGAVLSSHATGWLPEGYFSNPEKYDKKDRGKNSIIWSAPQRRTFGQEYYNAGKDDEEIEIHDLAAAIPYHLDYILFDACLMATVEVAWQLKDVCSYLAASPCEIPAAGMDYSCLVEPLLGGETPDLEGVCRAYFARYENDGTYGATISMIDCGALQGLADVCRPLFERYRSEIRTLSGGNVQVYDRLMGKKDYYAFFDLKDMLREAGALESELAAVQEALDAVLVYEAHTAKFISIPLKRCCGLAVYLPARPDYPFEPWHGTRVLDSLYHENVAWNQATRLVEFPL